MLLKPVSFLKKSAAASSPIAYIGNRTVTGNGPVYTFGTGGLSPTPSAGDRVVLAVMADRWDGTDLVTEMLIDPGGGNETAATFRALSDGTTNEFYIEVFDVIWPASSDFSVQITMGRSGFKNMGLAVLNANSLTYGSAVAKATTATSTGFFNITGTFTAGASVAMFVYGTYASTGISISSGLDSFSQFTTDRTNLVGVDEAATGSSTVYEFNVEAFKTAMGILVEYE